jgi:hypothetical protein
MVEHGVGITGGQMESVTQGQGTGAGRKFEDQRPPVASLSLSMSWGQEETEEKGEARGGAEICQHGFLLSSLFSE